MYFYFINILYIVFNGMTHTSYKCLIKHYKNVCLSFVLMETDFQYDCLYYLFELIYISKVFMESLLGKQQSFKQVLHTKITYYYKSFFFIKTKIVNKNNTNRKRHQSCQLTYLILLKPRSHHNG